MGASFEEGGVWSGPLDWANEKSSPEGVLSWEDLEGMDNRWTGVGVVRSAEKEGWADMRGGWESTRGGRDGWLSSSIGKEADAAGVRAFLNESITSVVSSLATGRRGVSSLVSFLSPVSTPRNAE